MKILINLASSVLSCLVVKTLANSQRCASAQRKRLGSRVCPSCLSSFVQQKNETADLEEREELGSDMDLATRVIQRVQQSCLDLRVEVGCLMTQNCTAPKKKKGLPGGPVDKNLSAKTGDMGSIPAWEDPRPHGTAAYVARARTRVK